MITISEDCDWCTAVCRRLFCLRLKIYAFRHVERETKSELKRHRSVQRKRDTPLKRMCCKTERKHSLIISAWHFSPGLGDPGPVFPLFLLAESGSPVAFSNDVILGYELRRYADTVYEAELKQLVNMTICSLAMRKMAGANFMSGC